MSEAGDHAEGEAAHGLLSRLARLLAVAGGLIMLAGAVMITVSVALRWLRNDGVQGDFELMQIATVLAVFCFFPLCQTRRGNVFVDTFTLKAPKAFNRALDAFWDLVFALVAGLIAWRLALGALDAVNSQTISMVLRFPVGWAIAAASLLAAFLCLAALVTAWMRARSA